MEERPIPQQDSLPLEVLQKIDRVCRRFEAECKTGSRPQIEDYLGDTPEPARSQLRRELAAVDAEYQKPKPKSTVSVDTFIQRLNDSGLMTAADCRRLIEQLPTERRPSSGEELAQELFRQKKLTRFQAQAVYQGKTRGLVVGNYVVLDTLGRGGMGYVYKAQHRKMKRIVALKMLPSSSTRSAEAVRRFQREVEAAAKLSHANIVTAHDADESQGVHFLVMEFVEGKDLAQIVREKGSLTVAKAVDYILQAARGLDYAHRNGIIHRDIKPSNLLLDRQGVVKVLDMGLARIDQLQAEEEKAASEGLTQTGQVMGTLDYMPPEQALDTHLADARADVYSLGCTLHYLLTGRSPYGGDTVGRKIVAHREDPIPSLCAVRKDVPEALDRLFQSMLAKHPEDRPQSMAQVIAELGRCPSAVGPVPPPLPDMATGMSLATTASETRANALDAEVDTASRMFSLAPPVEELRVDQTIHFPPILVQPDRKTRTRVSKRKWVTLAVALGLLSLAVLSVILVRINRPDGTLVVEISEPDVIVQILNAEGTVVIERKAQPGPLKIGVDAGKHRLLLEKDGVEIFAQEFSIAIGGKKTIDARFEPVPEVANAGPEKDKEPPPAVAPFDAAQARQHQEAWAQHLGMAVETTNSIGMKLTLIPPGEFDMGATQEQVASWLAEAKQDHVDPKVIVDLLPSQTPQHRVRITRPFCLGTAEVTVAQFREFADDTGFLTDAERDGKGGLGFKSGVYLENAEWTWRHPGLQQSDDHPVVEVSWNDAVAFCQWLGRKEGTTYRLPSEAEWEYACRAGTTTQYSFGDDAASLSEYAWWLENSSESTHPVGRKKANAFGLFDMHGNVVEFCQDLFGRDYYANSPRDDPMGPAAGSSRLLRNNAWNSSGGFECASRNCYTPARRSSYCGFRIARTLTLRPFALLPLPANDAHHDAAP